MSFLKSTLIGLTLSLLTLTAHSKTYSCVEPISKMPMVININANKETARLIVMELKSTDGDETNYTRLEIPNVLVKAKRCENCYSISLGNLNIQIRGTNDKGLATIEFNQLSKQIESFCLVTPN